MDKHKLFLYSIIILLSLYIITINFITLEKRIKFSYEIENNTNIKIDNLKIGAISYYEDIKEKTVEEVLAVENNIYSNTNRNTKEIITEKLTKNTTPTNMVISYTINNKYFIISREFLKYPVFFEPVNIKIKLTNINKATYEISGELILEYTYKNPSSYLGVDRTAEEKITTSIPFKSILIN